MISKEEFPNFKKENDIVGCYVECNGSFLLLYRQSHKRNGDKFGLPAGKVDPGETIEEAVKREIREETGLDIPTEKIRFIDSLFVRHEGHDFIYHSFVTVLDEEPVITINPAEHQKYKWVSPVEALEMNLIHDLDVRIKAYYKI